MENGWSLFNNNSSATSSNSGSRGQNSHSTSNLLAWEVWDWGTSPRFDWSTNNSFRQEEHNLPSSAAPAAVAATTAHPEGNGVHAVMLTHQGHNGHQTVYAGAGSRYHPDPHFMCLKLGKRHYFEDATPMADRHVGGLSIAKRGRSFYGGGGVVFRPSTSAEVTVASPAVVPRCQVEGCDVALVNAKDYHRRHKVCEMHSKAPQVVVLGLEQRFCQQCSRFHKVCEFDDSKRSCRRRLAGHNERRRKGSNSDSIARNPSQGGAFSLLSSKNNSWFSSADLSSRCSAALRELIAENRATILARQLVLDRDFWHRHHHGVDDPNGSQPGSFSSLQVSGSSHQQVYAADHQPPNGWDRFNEGGGEHVTLDLMEAPSSAFGFLSVGGKSKEEEDGCSELWSSLG